MSCEKKTLSYALNTSFLQNSDFRRIPAISEGMRSSATVAATISAALLFAFFAVTLMMSFAHAEDAAGGSLGRAADVVVPETPPLVELATPEVTLVQETYDDESVLTCDASTTPANGAIVVQYNLQYVVHYVIIRIAALSGCNTCIACIATRFLALTDVDSPDSALQTRLP